MKRPRSSRSVNPTIGFAEDLFAPPGTLTPVVKPLDEMTEAEIKKLPRSAFSEGEWDQLDDDMKEWIYENDKVSKSRVENLVNEFVQRHKSLEEPDERYLQDRLEENFDYHFQEAGDDYVNYIFSRGSRGAREELDGIIDEFKERGFSQEQITEALNTAFEDRDNWEFSYNTDEYGPAFFKAGTTESFYIAGDELDDLLDGMNDDEMERAIEEINNETRLSLRLKDLQSTYKRTGRQEEFHRDYEVSAYVTYYADADPNWGKISAAVAATLEGEEPEGEDVDPTLEGRILYRFADGHYVVNLLARELPAEGRGRNICVGSSEYHYGEAINEGRTQIWSLRDSDGKRLFTIEVRMKPDGTISYVNQIRAADNRIPEARHHVEMAIELFKAVGIPWKHIKDIKDLKPGIHELKALPGRSENPDDIDDIDDDYCEHCGGPAVGFCRPFGS